MPLRFWSTIFRLICLLSVGLPAWVDAQGASGNLPASSAFARWVRQHTNFVGTTPLNPQILADGLSLAQVRRAEMRSLLERNPEEFVRRAMPGSQRAQLPVPLQSLIEHGVSGRGFFGIYCLGVKPGLSIAPARPPLHGDYGCEVRLNGVAYKG